MRQFFVSLLEIAEVALIAVGAVIIVRTYFGQPFLVSGASMAPTFENGDYLLVDELTYRFQNPERGQVIVFRYPRDESTFFIKRIIGLPGETVRVRNNVITISNKEHPDGFELKESYLSQDIRVSGNLEVKLTDTQYFTLGDNRSFSFDSRNWGPLEAKEIVGLVRLRLWPINQAGAFGAPQY